MIGQLIPNLAVKKTVAIARPATMTEVENTRRLTNSTQFSLNIGDPNVALHILAAIAKDQNLEFALVPEPDQKVNYDSWNNSADFAMENGIITEGSLSLLGSSAVQHHMKGFSLHFARDFRELKANPNAMKAFVSDVRTKLAKFHHIPIDRVIIMSVRDGTSIVDVLIVDPGPVTPLSLEEEYRQLFGDDFLGCSIHPSFLQMQIKPSTFAPRWNRDFRDVKNCPVGEKRAGYDYKPPRGWQRFGMNVAGKYAGGDAWLGYSNKPGEWALVYHGTFPQNVKGITESPLHPGPRDDHGRGIYCSPDPKVAEQYARGPLEVETNTGRKKFKYMFMCRVNVSSVCRCNQQRCQQLSNPHYTVHITQDNNEWLVGHQNAGSEYIRPYGILIKEV
jgi:hypothetical protein